MEACGNSHHWARTFAEHGFNIRLIPTQHVKAFVRGNKNDANDALAIAESVLRPDLHAVPTKTLEQQDIQTLLRIRSRYKDARRINATQLRGLLAEYCLVIPTGINMIPKEIPFILEDAENGLTSIGRQAMALLLAVASTTQIKIFDHQLKSMAHQHESAIALMHLRGISALALFASIGKGNQFKKARQLST